MRTEPLTEADLPALQGLAKACLDADGGLPMFAEAAILRSRLLRAQTLAIREAGRLVAAAGVTLDGGAATASGMVAPDVRGRGLGSRLLRWTVDQAGDATLTVVTETLAPDAERLYARHGLVRTFAEEVMRHDLAAVPVVEQPSGIRVVPMTDGRTADLFSAYAVSFADRPGFILTTPQEWLGDLEFDPNWRRDLSAVVLDTDGVPVGFVNVLGRWIDQVGVMPAWRGRGLGAHLVAAVLQALADEGTEPVWLTVNQNNPAAALYRRLGFARYGIRARYVRPATAPGPVAPDRGRRSPGAP
jgi:ribosomal protein S18 acetylase RimI-like enzyme